MKYGDTLRQRSIPEWGHYNIDYDYLKDLIKHHTTQGTGKAVSIPGQGDTAEKAFGDTFFRVLKAQHDRINLFIKSKSGEIERRLNFISKRLVQLQNQRPRNAPLPTRIVEKYAKIDADVIKAGEEIRSLSRFRIAQRTGFHKILKKYKRWTRDRGLEHRFKGEVTESPDSFFQVDLGSLLDQYIDVLTSLRAPLNEDVGTNTGAQNTTSQITKVVQEGSDVDFDVALSIIPLGHQGSRATYWIHPDNIVEVQVLLLQYLRLHTSSGTSPTTPKGSPFATPARRKSSATFDKYFGNEDDVGFVILDDVELYARKQNASTVGSSEEATGVLRGRAAGNARWTSSGDAAIVVGLESNQNVRDRESIKRTKLKRKHLATFLEASSTSNDELESASSEDERKGIIAVQQWLAQHRNIKPIAGTYSKRTRFVGLHNNEAGAIWALLDRDVFVKPSLHTYLKNNEWVSEAREASTEFPHAVLEVRREGNHPLSLIQILDRSHLVERVRSFSLETHAVWTCCRPVAMSTPFWISLLDKDIRKLPAPIRRQRRKASSITDTVSHPSSAKTASSTPSLTDGQSSPVLSRNGESSVTSAPEFVEPPSLRAFRKKRKSYSNYPPPIGSEEPRQRYWNEYDNPESADEGYYIYIDPNASIKFPGQEFLETWAARAKQFFHYGLPPHESPLLSTVEDGTSDEEETVDEPIAVVNKSYGTMSLEHGVEHRAGGYFSSLFRSLRDPHRDAATLDSIRRQSTIQRQTLLSQIEIRQHEREVTKFWFYSTSLAAAVVIVTILSVLTTTSRKKERGVADAAVLFGTICSLLLCCGAIVTMETRRERLGWVHQGLVFVVVIGVVVVDVLLLRWILGS
ncbi:hypothetical protein CC78DRAFT_529492 [Lojkania enalia]|uniref:SPX domain-containing protein n=1 Tax=Lojkania enalia TaxID=147567 RepID=A0A9P4TQ21_9PLEO|nr:hypothetical protein CC78DRAFT_529492 [Didymosphaeria enalia]